MLPCESTIVHKANASRLSRIRQYTNIVSTLLHFIFVELSRIKGQLIPFDLRKTLV